jgi:hypothetical protein
MEKKKTGHNANSKIQLLIFHLSNLRGRYNLFALRGTGSG